MHWGEKMPLSDIVVLVASHVAYHTGELNALLAMARGEAWEDGEEVEENHISTVGHRVPPPWMPEERYALFRVANLPEDMAPAPPDVMPAMLTYLAVRPSKVAREHVGTVVAWRFDDGAEYHIAIGDRGKPAWGEGAGDNPRMTFVSSFPTWLKVAAGILDGADAVQSGNLRIEGDAAFAPTYLSLFSR